MEAGSAYPTGAPMFTSRFLSGVRVARPLVFYVVFSRSLVFFSFGHVFVRPSSIYSFWLPLWYLQTFLHTHTHIYIYIYIYISHAIHFYQIFNNWKYLDLEMHSHFNLNYGFFFSQILVLRTSPFLKLQIQALVFSGFKRQLAMKELE